MHRDIFVYMNEIATYSKVSVDLLIILFICMMSKNTTYITIPFDTVLTDKFLYSRLCATTVLLRVRDHPTSPSHSDRDSFIYVCTAHGN